MAVFFKQAGAFFRRPQVWVAGLAAIVLFGQDSIALVRLAWQRRQLDKQLDRIEADRAQLTAIEERLQNDPVYVEDLIRSTFKFSAPGERVIPSKNVTSQKHPWQTSHQ
jgi:cell division protein FtsB